jgi:hypothetical protein
VVEKTGENEFKEKLLEMLHNNVNKFVDDEGVDRALSK